MHALSNSHAWQTAVRASLALALTLGTAPAAASVPSTMVLQGAAELPGGVPIASPADFEVLIYDTATAVTPVYTETFADVALSQGRFALPVGTAPDGALSLAEILRAYDALWVAMSIDGDDETPRTRLQSVAFALECSHAVEADTLALSCADGNLLAHGDGGWECAPGVSAAQAGFDWALGTSKGGAAADLDCVGCVGATDVAPTSIGAAHLQIGGVSADNVAFSFAKGTTKNGAAADLDCSGCVDGGHISANASLAGLVRVDGLEFADTGGNGVMWTVSEDLANTLVFDYGSTSLSVSSTGVLNVDGGVIVGSTPVIDSSGNWIGPVDSSGLTSWVQGAGHVTTTDRVGVGVANPAQELSVAGQVQLAPGNVVATNAPADGGLVQVSQGQIAIEQTSGNGDTRLFADFAPYHSFGLYYSNDTDRFHFTRRDGAGLQSWQEEGPGGTTTTTSVAYVDLAQGDAHFAGTVYADAGVGSKVVVKGGGIAIEQLDAEGDTRLFADFAPHHSWGMYHENAPNQIHFTRRDGSGLKSWAEAGPGGTTTTTSVAYIDLDSGDAWFNGTVHAAGVAASDGGGTVKVGDKGIAVEQTDTLGDTRLFAGYAPYHSQGLYHEGAANRLHFTRRDGAGLQSWSEAGPGGTTTTTSLAYVDLNDGDAHFNGTVYASSFVGDGVGASAGTLEVADGETAIRQTSSEGNTRLFADYNPYHSWGIYHENGPNLIHFTRRDGAGLKSWSEAGPGGTTTTVSTAYIDLASGDAHFQGKVYAGEFVGGGGGAPLEVTTGEIAIQQMTTEGNTRIFADYAPHHSWGIFHENATDTIHLTRRDGSGLGSWSEAGPGGTTTTTSMTQFHLGSGSATFAGDVATKDVVLSPGNVRGTNAPSDGGLIQATDKQIAIQQTTGEGDTRIFADFAPYHSWGIYHENGPNLIHFTRRDGAGLSQWSEDGPGGATTTSSVAQINLGTGAGTFLGTVTAGNLLTAGNLAVGTTAPLFDADIRGDANVVLNVHHSNADLGADFAGIGLSMRGDGGPPSGDTRAGLFYNYNGNLFLSAASAVTDLHLKPLDYARLFIRGSDGFIGMGTTAPPHALSVESDANTAIHLKANQGGAANYTGALLIAETNIDYRARGLMLTTTDANSSSAWFAGVPYTGQSFQIGNSSDHTTTGGSADGAYTKSKARVTIDVQGRMGIGTTAPVTQLDVAGGVRVGNHSATCASGLAGTIRWTGSQFEGCNGSAWRALDLTTDTDFGGGTSSQGGEVRRDFLTWRTPAGGNTPIHIKTNIKIKSYIMYRILVEGYNYGLARAINSDTVGYTYGGWACSGNVQNNNYASGASISQYCSSDGYVVIRLDPNGSNYYIGFGVSGWFTNPTGYGFDISATVYHQAANL